MVKSFVDRRLPRDLRGSSPLIHDGRGAAGAAAALWCGDFLFSRRCRVPRLGGCAAARGCWRGRRSRTTLVVYIVLVRVKTPPSSAEHRDHRKILCTTVAGVQVVWIIGLQPCARHMVPLGSATSDRMVCSAYRGASFTLCVCTGLQLSECSRDLCFHRLCRSPTLWVCWLSAVRRR